MGSKPSTALAATVVAVALASFPAGAAAVKDYSQNSVNGEAAAPLPAELLKDYSMNAATGDYAPPIHHARPTRVGRIHDDAGTTAPGPQPSSTSEGRFGQVGGWIAYSSGDGIWAVDPARAERQIRLSRADGDPIGWSSDGTKLLIRRKSPNQVRGGVGETDLFVFDADGTETRLTNAQTFVTGGSFSPDGSEVVYATTFSPKGSAIYAVSSDGGAPRLILRATRRVSIEGRRVLTDVYHPALSPDGTQIGYFDGMGDHSHNLWVMNADGTERRLLLDHEVAGPGHMYALTWSPDGEWLAFQTDNRIYLVRSDGTGLRPVVEGFFIAASAVQWSPDGSRIAYLRGGALSIVNVDGGDERIIEQIRATSIAWNPAV